jgi:hypothetical protein
MSIETNIRQVTAAEAKKLAWGFGYAWSVRHNGRFIGSGFVPTKAHAQAAIAECERILGAEEPPC